MNIHLRLDVAAWFLAGSQNPRYWFLIVQQWHPAMQAYGGVGSA
jgi:hypothetical protein